LIVSGVVRSICTNTSKKLVGIPVPELSKIAREKESGVKGSTCTVPTSSRNESDPLALGMNV
jgi:hypothetical protein